MQTVNVVKTLKEGPLSCVLLVMCSFYYLMVIHHDFSNVVVEPVTECPVEKKPTAKNFISSQCNCAKMIPVFNESQLNDNDRFQWCSKESGLRGDHQRVVSYALFGEAQNASLFRRYYGLMKNISLTIEKEYPGWVMRIYHAFTDHDREGYRVYATFTADFHTSTSAA